VKDKFIGPERTFAKFLDKLRPKFYAAIIQHQKEKELTELGMSGGMTVLQYVIMELSHSFLTLLPLSE